MTRRLSPLFVRIAAVVLLLALGVAVGLWWKAPGLTEEEVQRAVVTTIQREVPASFFVTGVIEATATTTVRNTKYLLPDLLGLNLGTTQATVRMPGRISYGFDAAVLRPEMIRLGDDDVVEVTLPELRIHAVEPDLSAMEVQTTVGWARLHSSSGQRVEQQAMEHVQRGLRRQGQDHLQRSTQPRLNTARALEKLLTPVLQAAGMAEPRFRFQIGPHLVLTPGD